MRLVPGLLATFFLLLFVTPTRADNFPRPASLEPNVTFTPDGKWIVFRSNMHGPSYVYAVEVAKANN